MAPTHPDPGDAAPTTRSLTLPTGEHVDVWTPAGDVRGVALVQHGLAEHAGRYVTEHGAIIPRLVERGFEAWAMELVGHGRSPGARGVVNLPAAVAAHVALRHQARRPGVPLVVIGHSLGGLVTAGSVATDPTGVDRAVVLSPALVAATPAPLRWAARAGGVVVPGVPVRRVARGADELTRDAAVGVRAAEDPLMAPGRLRLRTGAGILEVSHRVFRRARSWSTPTLVMHGTDDHVTDPRQSARLVALMPPKVGTLVRVEGGVHELLHDTDGPATLARVLAFVDAAVEA